MNTAIVRFRPPSDWCEPFVNVINEQSPRSTGTWVIIDLNSVRHQPACGGREWRIVKAEIAHGGTFVCEHNIEIGD